MNRSGCFYASAKQRCALRADKETVNLIRPNLTLNQMLIEKSCPVSMTTSIGKKEDRISIKTGLILPNGYNGADRSEDNGILKYPFMRCQIVPLRLDSCPEVRCRQLIAAD